MVTEDLECRWWSKTYISWSQDILSQLDAGHHCQFPTVLTYRGTCDLRVITLLRSQTLGNSSALSQHILDELHSEEWLSNESTIVPHWLSNTRRTLKLEWWAWWGTDQQLVIKLHQSMLVFKQSNGCWPQTGTGEGPGNIRIWVSAQSGLDQEGENLIGNSNISWFRWVPCRACRGHPSLCGLVLCIPITKHYNLQPNNLQTVVCSITKILDHRFEICHDGTWM